MSWYQCNECGTAMDVRALRRVTHPADMPHHCIDCGSPAPAVIDSEEVWWLTMERSHGLSRDLLKDLLNEWEQQRIEPRFDLWLESYLASALAEEAS